MGYRLPEERDDRSERIDDVARQTKISVDNGAISRLAIPTFFPEHCDKLKHDHLGWPYPGHPDDSCQLPPGCEYVLNEIDLPSDGYTTIEVSMVDPPEGLTFTGTIEYNTVNITIAAMCPDAATEDLDVTFAIYATGIIDNDYDEEDVPLRDVITKGTLHIVAGAIG